LFLVMRKLI